tara:strand:+ start:609 stop:746 length:138 start_codon:yes stop_codon:yes gene_type:complete
MVQVVKKCHFKAKKHQNNALLSQLLVLAKENRKILEIIEMSLKPY